jgi:hypothetical protein
MDISTISSSAAAQSSDAISLAVQKMTLNSMKSQGAQLTSMLAPRGSVNLPSQGNHIDAFA